MMRYISDCELKARGANAISRLAVSGLIFVLLGCPTDEEGNPDLQGCKTTVDAGFPTSGDVDHHKPASCPFDITGETTVPFTATATMPHGSTTYNYYNAWVTDREDNFSSATFSSSWQVVSSGTIDLIQISGNYLAGQGGFDQDTVGHDLWSHEFVVNAQYKHARTRLTYKNGTPKAVIGGPPSGVASYTSYEVSAIVTDPLMVGSATWDWYADGNYVGTSSDGHFTITTGAPDSEQRVDVIVTDADSHVRYGLIYVTVCPANQFTC